MLKHPNTKNGSVVSKKRCASFHVFGTIHFPPGHQQNFSLHYKANSSLLSVCQSAKNKIFANSTMRGPFFGCFITVSPFLNHPSSPPLLTLPLLTRVKKQYLLFNSAATVPSASPPGNSHGPFFRPKPFQLQTRFSWCEQEGTKRLPREVLSGSLRFLCSRPSVSKWLGSRRHIEHTHQPGRVNPPPG